MNRDSSLPIIRIEIEGMRHSILRALSEREVQMDKHVADALQRYVDSGELARTIDREISAAIERAIKENAESYFRYGEGRKLIADMVAARIRAETGDES